ncbi:hypothetical protein FQN54_009123 [Arachnomyces sp. PD_36]|nr:hypothetical protein FQN54_009123 [Arachnomyces sp. PD_36]
MLFQASYFLLSLIWAGPATASIAHRSADGDPSDFKYLRAVSTPGSDGNHKFNDYIQVAYDIDYDGIDYYFYFITYPGSIGNLTTVDPYPKGNLRISGDKRMAYLIPKEVDDNLLGLYDFRWGEPLPTPSVKYESFYEDSCTNQLAYDDTPKDNAYNGTFVAKVRRYESDGSSYIRWWNGPGPLPKDYSEVQLKRDPVIFCEAMGCTRGQEDMCRAPGCEWEDTWKKPDGC